MVFRLVPVKPYPAPPPLPARTAGVLGPCGFRQSLELYRGSRKGGRGGIRNGRLAEISLTVTLTLDSEHDCSIVTQVFFLPLRGVLLGSSK